MGAAGIQWHSHPGGIGKAAGLGNGPDTSKADHRLALPDDATRRTSGFSYTLSILRARVPAEKVPEDLGGFELP